jgi:hypothetical protein
MLVFLPTSRLLWPVPKVLASTVFSSVSLISSCLSQTNLNWLIFNFSYLGSHRCSMKDILAYTLCDSILSITTGNKLVSKEVSICYRRHMHQQIMTANSVKNPLCYCLIICQHIWTVCVPVSKAVQLCMVLNNCSTKSRYPYKQAMEAYGVEMLRSHVDAQLHAYWPDAPT